jgi:xylulokinase
MKYLLGFDIGSSSVKVALVEGASGKTVASAFSPSTEMPIISTQTGFAEQDPEDWWKELINAMHKLKSALPFKPDEVISIGISYQMHGLVCLDKQQRSLRPSIIWCDSRAVGIGDRAFKDLGPDYCLKTLLNSPGNFTASKLRWVRENEPALYEKIDQFLLPGDYIAMKLTGIAATSIPGLSEAICWDYPAGRVATALLDYYEIDDGLLPPLVPTFGEQGRLSSQAATLLGLSSGIPVSYRAGDQPNNAWSLNTLQPGEIAANAGTSGVIYGVTDEILYDKRSRVNTFVHVNHQGTAPRYGVLLCVNGTGILNSWVQKNLFPGVDYASINAMAAKVAVGSDGLQFFPFGNGAERILLNKEMGAQLMGLQFNRHRREHVARAAQEGIAFSLHYGAEIMQEMGISLKTIRAGYANMFLSDVFAKSFANATNCRVELYRSDGAVGAARGAGFGSGYYKNINESFKGMEIVKSIEPSKKDQASCLDAYTSWKKNLLTLIQ